MKYLHALRIGQTFKMGLLGIAFFGGVTLLGYLIIPPLWKIIMVVLNIFISLYPSLQSPYRYAFGVVELCIMIYLFGIILSIRVHEESLIQKIAGVIPGCRFALQLFEELKRGIKNIKNCSFVLIKNSAEKSWEDADFIIVGIILGGQTIRISPHNIFHRPKITVSIPPNPITGFLCWPHRDCVLLLQTPHNFLIRLFISCGILGPEILDAAPDQTPLNEYYQHYKTHQT